MNRTHRQPRDGCHLLRRKSPRRLAEELQKPQPALKRANVVIAFRTYVHDDQAKMKNAGLSGKNPFCATPPV